MAMRTADSLAASCLRASGGGGKLLRRGLAYRLEGEPTRHICVIHSLPQHDLAALRHYALPVPHQKRKRFERGVLPEEATTENHNVARRDREEIAPVEVPSHVLDA